MEVPQSERLIGSMGHCNRLSAIAISKRHRVVGEVHLCPCGERPASVVRVRLHRRVTLARRSSGLSSTSGHVAWQTAWIPLTAGSTVVESNIHDLHEVSTAKPHTVSRTDPVSELGLYESPIISLTDCGQCQECRERSVLGV